ncbi:Transducin beta-like protein 3 [Zancudomyces culisetae]|uniref:Transducin beta-like protein 3 n=1 Tax=Zancudomyces culisetae TaxID=1213189 RepID=A0A1R1PQR5_ZANCU|nr:Transducin beta-like protein 3 [Zancudomyces culisetae]|eukprot:OMH83325.1 Transducin beta-like protein 3 [Zancudomyces culisetae]
MASKKVERTEVVYERVEAMEVVGNKTVYYGGEGGRMKVFKIEKGVSEDVEMEDANDSGNKDEEIVWIAKSEDTNTIIQADSEQNIMGFSCDNLNKKKWQIAGYNDEVIESRYIESGNKIAVISNSDKLKIYNTETLECEEMVRGAHDDIILSMDVYGTYIATGSKDRTIKLWEYKDNKISLLAKGVGHMGAVGAIKIVPLKDGGVELVSGSMDSSIKRWKYGNGTLVGEYTIIKVHEKGDVNTLNVNTDQGIIVSGGSQDKVGRILNYRDGSVVGELKGHKRGIWAIEFYGHIVATSSGDSTIKLWSLNSNYDCIQTIDCGSTVLSMKIISNGMQILGGCNDALVRLFNISSSQVVAMFGGENSGPNKGHSDKIWSLDTFNDSSLMVTGSSDSKIIIWNDQSQVLLDQYIQKQQEDLLTSQKLDNLLSNNGDLILAFKLALSLNKPHTCLSILSKHTNRSTSATSSDAYEFYDVLIKSLSPEEVSNLLNLVLVDWSTNLKLAAFYSQILLFSIFKHHRSVLMDNHQSIKSLIPHTNKFLKFWNSLLSDSAMLDFYLQFS